MTVNSMILTQCGKHLCVGRISIDDRMFMLLLGIQRLTFIQMVQNRWRFFFSSKFVCGICFKNMISTPLPVCLSPDFIHIPFMISFSIFSCHFLFSFSVWQKFSFFTLVNKSLSEYFSVSFSFHVKNKIRFTVCCSLWWFFICTRLKLPYKLRCHQFVLSSIFHYVHIFKKIAAAITTFNMAMHSLIVGVCGFDINIRASH